MGEEYEGLVAAIAMIDAASAALEGIGTQHEAISILDSIRNDLNVDRLACLGNGQEPPYHVSDLRLTEKRDPTNPADRMYENEVMK